MTNSSFENTSLGGAVAPKNPHLGDFRIATEELRLQKNEESWGHSSRTPWL